MHPLAPNLSPTLNALALCAAAALDAVGYTALWRFYRHGPGGEDLREGRAALARLVSLTPFVSFGEPR